jgi:D-alanyl-D-alanine carboxypeptidase
MRCPRLAGLLVLVLLGGATAARADSTDDFIRSRMQRQRIPGVALVVLKDGMVVKSAGYGVADRESGAPVTADTVFKIASVSKQFIATGVMVLVQDGRLALSDPVSKYLHDAPVSWQAITIRHLLTHTSGLVRGAPGWEPFGRQSDADVIRTSYDTPLRFTPGDKWEYSNLGYYVLAEIVTRVSGQSWSAFMTERVFRPAGLTSTRTTTMDPAPNRAKGYSDNDRLTDALDWPSVRPSGAFLSTVVDLARWDVALNTEAVLTEASRREMWTPVRLNDGTTFPYGFGWYVSRPGARRRVYHGGGLPGFAAQFHRFLDDRVTVVLLINLDDVDDESIALGVADLYLPERN